MVYNSRDNDNPSMVMIIDLHHKQKESNQDSAPHLPKGGTIVSLADPNSGEARHFLRVPRSKGCDLFEIQSTSRKSTYGSFFVGSRVVSDGALYVSTRLDPLFFALHALEQKSSSASSSKWQPLEQLLADIPRSVQDALLCSSSDMSQLKHLCETNDKFGDDLVLFRFSPDRALKWLTKKQERAFQAVKQQMLETKRLDFDKRRKKSTSSGGSGAFSSSFKLASDENTPSQCTPNVVSPTNNGNVVVLSKQEERQAVEASLQVVCEYLSTAWRAKLVQSFHLTESVLLAEKEKRASQEESTAGDKKRKAPWEAAPGANEANQLLQFTMGVGDGGGGESMDKSAKAKKTPAAQTVGLKKLAKVSTKGMKTLSSFFGGPAKKAKKKSN